MATTQQLPIAQTQAAFPSTADGPNRAFTIALRSLAIVSGIAVFLYAHTLWALAIDWWKDPNYSHGFIMPLFAAFAIWRARQNLMNLEMQPSWWGYAICICAMAMYVVGELGAEFFSSRFSILVLIIGAVVLFLGWKHLRALSFPLVLLLMMIPIPAIVMNQITFPLQLNASQLATGLLSAIGVPVIRDGNVMQLPSTSLEVVEACSGIRSLMSLIALAAVFGYLQNHPLWRRWLLVIFAVPIAVIANALRIMGTGLLAEYWDPDKAEGFFHMFEGWVIFVLSLFLLLILDKTVSWISAQRKQPGC